MNKMRNAIRFWRRIGCKIHVQFHVVRTALKAAFWDHRAPLGASPILMLRCCTRHPAELQRGGLLYRGPRVAVLYAGRMYRCEQGLNSVRICLEDSFTYAENPHLKSTPSARNLDVDCGIVAADFTMFLDADKPHFNSANPRLGCLCGFRIKKWRLPPPRIADMKSTAEKKNPCPTPRISHLN